MAGSAGWADGREVDKCFCVFSAKGRFSAQFFSVCSVVLVALQHLFVASEASHNKPLETDDKQK